VLLVSCGLLLRAALRVQSTDPGFKPDGVLALSTILPMPKYERVAVRQRFFDAVLGDVKALPGVSQAAYITGLPMVMTGGIWRIRIPGQPEQTDNPNSASLRFVTPGFFSALSIPLLVGRDVAVGDTQSTSPVALVSESFVQRYLPGQDALGRTFSLRNIDRRIVGVVGDVRVRGLEQGSEPQVYLPASQMEDARLSGYVPKDLVVKSATSPTELIPAIRAIIARADPQQPVSDVRSVAEIVAGETAPRRVQVRVLGAFAAIAFLLAGVGLHGLLAFNVSQRAREIGVRLALGEERWSIVAMIMRRGLRLAAIGVLVGAVLALAAGRALQALLAGVSPTDAAAFAGAVGMTIVMTVIGSLLPAVRAMRMDPIEVMRAE
jgi:predicted permease